MGIKISIGVVVYNIQEDFLRQCIESIAFQLCDEAELLIVDDCSTNGADKTCEEYSNGNKYIRYIRLPQNGGVSVARNEIIKSSLGKYLCFIDGDDAVPTYYVKQMLSACEKGYDIIMGDRISFSGALPDLSEKKPCNIKPLDSNMGNVLCRGCLTSNLKNGTFYGMGYHTSITGIQPKIYDINFLKENNILFSVGQKKSQDVLFNILAFHCAKSIAYIPSILYFYRYNPNSICHRYSPDYLIFMRSYIKTALSYIKEFYNDDELVKREFYQYRIMIFATNYMQLNIFHKDNPKSKKERKKLFEDFMKLETFKTCFEISDINGYGWHEKRLALKLAKKGRFFMLDFLYKHPFGFALYGGVYNRLNKLFKLR